MILNRLVEKGNTVIVIEHKLDVVKMADHVVDVGPSTRAETFHVPSNLKQNGG